MNNNARPIGERVLNVLKLYLVFIILVVFVISCARDRHAYEKAQEQNTVEAYQSFITEYPDSELKEQARKAIAALTAQAFTDAKNVGSTDAMREFLKKYPNSAEGSQAQEIIKSLTTLSGGCLFKDENLTQEERQSLDEIEKRIESKREISALIKLASLRFHPGPTYHLKRSPTFLFYLRTLR